MAHRVHPLRRAQLLTELMARRRAGESFDAICATPGWPSRPTIRKWLRQDGLIDAVPAIRARPVRWSRDLADRICERLSRGEGLRELARDPAMPDRKTLATWAGQRPDFAADLWCARFDGGSLRCGRKTIRTAAIADAIYVGLCEQGAMTRVCGDPGMPHPRTVRDWARQNPKFASALALGREIHRELRGEALVGDLRAYRASLEAFIAWQKRVKAVGRRKAGPPPA